MLISIFAVLAGLAFGSFLNVCISRLPRHESIVSPRSRCPRCHAPILNRDNIPLLSWIALRGRCRSCRAPIPLRYPLVEAATAALFLLCFLDFDLTPRGIAAALLCWLLLGLAATDAETFRLPDALTLPGIALGVLVSALIPVDGTSVHLQWRPAAAASLSAAGAAALILLIRGLYWLVRRKEGIGIGDAKLLAMIAAWLGPWPTLLTLFVAVVGAAFYGLIILGWQRRVNRTDHTVSLNTRIPFGAFLSAAGLLALFEGNSILNWYWQFFQ